MEGLKMAICMVITPLTWDRTFTIPAIYIHLPSFQVELPTFPAPGCWDWWDAIWIRPQSSAGDAIQQTHAKQQQNGLRMSSVHLHKLGYGSPELWLYPLSSLGTLVLFLWLAIKKIIPFRQRMQVYYIYIYIHTPKIHKASTNHSMFFQNES